MGDSSVSCALSGMSMTYDRAVLIALAPASFSHVSRKHPSFTSGARVVGHSMEMFVPVLLPIFGKMDSYGGLEAIEKDEHTSFLETKLDLPIDQIAEEIILGGCLPRMRKAAKRVSAKRKNDPYRKQTVWDGHFYGCFVSREVWDRFTTRRIDEFGKSSMSAWESAMLDPVMLEGLGFRFVREDEAEAIRHFGSTPHRGTRYNHLYVNPQTPEIEAWCDDNMGAIFRVNGVELPLSFHAEEVQAHMQKLTPRVSFTPEAIKWAQTASTDTLTLLTARKQMRKHLKEEAERRERERKHPSLTFDVSSINGDAVTYCDGRVHVVMEGENLTMQPCPSPIPVGTNCAAPSSQQRRFLPSETSERLLAMGWKPKHFSRPLGSYEVPALGGFAPETVSIYGQKLLGRFLPRAAQLVSFTHVMTETNRLYQPNATGMQYGNLYLQRELAEVTHAILDRRIKERGC